MNLVLAEDVEPVEVIGDPIDSGDPVDEPPVDEEPVDKDP